MAEPQSEAGIEAHVLVTHYHWDHIQGIPFFHPFFESQNRFHFYSFQSKYLGPQQPAAGARSAAGQPLFSGERKHDGRERSFHEVAGGEAWEVNGTHITAAWLNHPQGCLGYRLDTTAGSIVYATDNEPGVAEFDQNLRAAGARSRRADL